jgi:Ca2+-binding RTX toxin-like protein
MADINGTPDDDVLFGTEGDDTIHAGSGHDYLRALGGDDSLHGEDGDDYLDGGPGDDLIDGGAGIDRVAFHTATSGIQVDLNIQGIAQNTLFGMDTLVGIEHASGALYADTIIGNGGDNWLWGEGGDDHIYGNGGNDLVEVGAGNVVADGGADNDTFSVWNNQAAYSVTLSLALQGGAQASGIGAMTLSGFENLSGSHGNDSLAGDGGANVLAGDEGNDQLSGGAGNDILYGDGRITIDTHDTGTSGPITTYADVAAAFPGGFTDGDDLLEGGDGNDSLYGGGGNDTASYAGAGGGEFVDLASGFATGAAGDDDLHSIENVVGSAYDDQILGDGGANTLAGGDGHDYLRARAGDDTLKGGNGDDYLGGGFGNDVIDGGAGWDRAAFFSDATGGVHVDLNIQGVAQDTGQGMDTLVSIEHASGTTFDDVLIGNSGDNWLWGENGNDTMTGGAGNDLIEAGPGNVTADGGTGDDTFSLWGNGAAIAGVNVSLLLQGGAQATGIGSDLLTGFENLSGSNGNDTLTGDGAANILAGDQGADTLNGGAGDDILYGDGRIIADTHGVGTSGPITIFGDVDAAGLSDPAPGDGNDVLSGGKGNDILVGGGGDDVLTGDQGNDRFVFGPHSGHDRITDFGHQDVIAFTDGPHSFSELILTASGKDTLISWGTGDSILVEGMKPKQLGAGDFSFAPGGAAATLAAADMPDSAHHAMAWHP